MWIYDLAATTSMRRLTQGGRNRFPVWSADGERVAFQSECEGDLGIFWQRADGTGAVERLTKPEQGAGHLPESWSPDGKTLLVSVAKGSIQSVATVALDSRKVAPFGAIESPVNASPIFSPDGRWVAYTGNVPGATYAMFVQPFPSTGATYQISKQAGIHPMWSPNGEELFYNPAAGQYGVVSVSTHSAFTFGNPSPVPRPFIDRGPAFERNTDMTRDVNRFIGVIDAAQKADAGGSTAPQIQIVLSWFEELKARVPAK